MSEAVDVVAENQDDIARDLFRRWLDAAESGDGSWFVENLSNEFIYHNSGGGVMTKAEIIEVNGQTDCRYSLDEYHGRLYGNCLLVFGVYSAKGTVPTNPNVSDSMEKKYQQGTAIRFASSWVRSGGKHACTLLQTTTID